MMRWCAFWGRYERADGENKQEGRRRQNAAKAPPHSHCSARPKREAAEAAKAARGQKQCAEERSNLHRGGECQKQKKKRKRVDEASFTARVKGKSAASSAPQRTRRAHSAESPTDSMFCSRLIESESSESSESTALLLSADGGLHLRRGDSHLRLLLDRLSLLELKRRTKERYAKENKQTQISTPFVSPSLLPAAALCTSACLLFLFLS